MAEYVVNMDADHGDYILEKVVGKHRFLIAEGGKDDMEKMLKEYER